jgi:hypothetical protein
MAKRAGKYIPAFLTGHIALVCARNIGKRLVYAADSEINIYDADSIQRIFQQALELVSGSIELLFKQSQPVVRCA